MEAFHQSYIILQDLTPITFMLAIPKSSAGSVDFSRSTTKISTSVFIFHGINASINGRLNSGFSQTFFRNYFADNMMTSFLG
jgi:hypothetical protein